MSDLAPIAVSTYIRLSHLQQTISALQNNTLAKDSEVYMLSDAPKAGHENKVRVLRKYLQTITGFKKVHIIERKTNSRVENNRGGIKSLLNRFGRVIFMEDDIVTASGFIQFMNDALNFYEHQEDILSVSGHTPNLKIFRNSIEDVYLSKRFHGWGVGFWAEKYKYIQEIPAWSSIKNDKQLLQNLKKMGHDMITMIKREAIGNIDALDIKACYSCAKHGYTNLLPTKTLVKNIGMDCSGVHCGSYDPFFLNELNTKTNFQMINNIKISKTNLTHYRKFFSRKQQIINKLSYFLLKKS